jgi:hypothetical protein
LPASSLIVSTTIEDHFIHRVFLDLARYPPILGIVDLRPLRGWHTYKTSLRSALLDSLQQSLEIWVSLHFVRSRPCLSFSSLFEHQTSHA